MADNQQVLACIDGAELSVSVAQYGQWIAQKVAQPLCLLHNIESHHVNRVDLTGSIGLGCNQTLLNELTELESKHSKLLKQHGEQLLENVRVQLPDNNNVITLQHHGALAESLVALEDTTRVLVLGARGEDHQNKKQALGTQLETIVRALQRPVLVVNGQYQQPSGILLAYDNSQSANKALEMICHSPLYQGMRCHLVYVGEPSEQMSHALQQAAQRVTDAGLIVEQQTLTGSPVEQLVAYQKAQQLDLLVMGAFGHSRLRKMLLGSFTLNMLQQAISPVLLLR